jgi:hypothetical protein
MYAKLACETGWTWEYIGEHMTLPRLYAFDRYWKLKYGAADGKGSSRSNNSQPNDSAASNDDWIGKKISSIADESPHCIRDARKMRVGR